LAFPDASGDSRAFLEGANYTSKPKRPAHRRTQPIDLERKRALQRSRRARKDVLLSKEGDTGNNANAAPGRFKDYCATLIIA
jgi:hypothetical protein